jgi:mannosyltransferase OCH1-like enzyme
MLPFVEEFFPEIYEPFKAAPLSILQLDIFRLLLVYKYGGIYIDLDIFVFENFYDEFNKKVAMLESTEYYKDSEFIQNAMFAAEPGNAFIKECYLTAIDRVIKISTEELFIEKDYVRADGVKYATGPTLISDVYTAYENQESVQILSNRRFNPGLFDFYDGQAMKHLMTGV